MLNLWWWLRNGPYTRASTGSLNSGGWACWNRTDVWRSQMSWVSGARLSVREHFWCSWSGWCSAVGLRCSPFIVRLEEDWDSWESWPPLLASRGRVLPGCRYRIRHDSDCECWCNSCEKIYQKGSVSRRQKVGIVAGLKRYGPTLPVYLLRVLSCRLWHKPL
jgi:hypothetical protein